MISTFTVGLVAAVLSNPIETSRPVVGLLQPRFRGGIDVRADGTVKTGYLVSEPLCVGHWVVLSLEKSRGGMGAGNCFGSGTEPEKKKTPPPSARRAEIGYASAGGLIACDLDTGRTLELIGPPPQRQPDRANSVASCYRAGPNRCAVVIKQQRKTGPDTGKVLGTYLWEWSLDTNALKPIGNWNAAELVKLVLDPRLVDVALVGSNSEDAQTLEVRDKESGRTTQIVLQGPRPLDPSGGGAIAVFGDEATVIPQADRRSFVIYQFRLTEPGKDQDEPRFLDVDPRSKTGRRWTLSNADFTRATGAQHSWTFPIQGPSLESGLIAVGLTDAQSAVDHIVLVEAATGHMRRVIPLPKQFDSEYRQDWIVSSDGSSAAYVATFPSGDDHRPASLVTIDLKTGRISSREMDGKHFPYVGSPFAIDDRGRLLTLGEDLLERITWQGAPAFEPLFRLDPLITSKDKQFTAAGMRRLGDLESLTSLEVSRTEMTADMLGELGRHRRLTHLHMNLHDEHVGELKGLANCTNLRSLTLAGKLEDPSIYRELGRLSQLQALDLRFGGWPTPKGVLDEIRRLTNLVSLSLAGFSPDDVELSKLQTLAKLQAFEFVPFGLNDANTRALAEFPQLASLKIDTSATGQTFQKLSSLTRLTGVDLSLGRGDINGAVRELAAYKHLNRLRLADNNRLSPGMLQKLGQLPELTELDLDVFGIDNGQEPIAGLTECKHLTRLRLTATSLKPADIDEILKLKNLKLFDLSHTWDAAVGLHRLFGLKNLEEFDIYSSTSYGNGLTDDDLVGLEGLSNLKALQLSGNAITDNGLGPIAALAQLTRLKLAHTYISDRGLGTLKPLSRLAKLDLFDTEISDDGLKELAAFRRLTDLDLGMTEITDAGLAHLRRLPALKRLNLESTSISDAGLRQLAAIESLEDLDLSGTAMTDAGLKELRPLKNLRSLALKRTAVTDAGLGELKAFPRLASLTIGR
jgi:internalin A